MFCLKQAIKITKNRQALYVCAIDATKIFGKVVRPILNNKISAHNTLALIKYYESSLMMVSNHGMYSKVFRITIMVRQGGVASSKLFLVYLDSILKELTEFDEGIKIGDIKLDILAYANDILIEHDKKKSSKSAENTNWYETGYKSDQNCLQ